MKRRFAAFFISLLVFAVPMHVLLAATILAGATATAHAQGDAERPADALLEEGVRHREAHEDERALRLFQRAYEIDGSARALAQIALAEKALGRFVDAETHLREALARDDEWIASHRAALDAELADLDTRLGTLEISGGADEARVVVDGRERGLLSNNRRVRARAGTITLELLADGFNPISRTVVIRAGGVARERINLIAEPLEGERGDPGGEVSPRDDDRPDRTRRQRNPADVGGGLAHDAVGAWTAAGAFTALAIGATVWQRDRAAAADDCQATDCERLDDIHSTADLALGLAAVGAGGAAGSLGLAAVLSLSDARGSERALPGLIVGGGAGLLALGLAPLWLDRQDAVDFCRTRADACDNLDTLRAERGAVAFATLAAASASVAALSWAVLSLSVPERTDHASACTVGPLGLACRIEL